MKRTFFALAFAALLSLSAFAQTLEAYPQTGNAPSKNGIAILTVSGDARGDVGDPTYLENGLEATFIGYNEVWFGAASGCDPTATPATGFRAKLLRFSYNLGGSGNSVFVMLIPEDAGLTVNNPYIRIMRDIGGGSYSQFTQFQVAAGTGGTLSTKPFISTNSDDGAIVGTVKVNAERRAIKPVGTVTIYDADNQGAAGQTFLCTMLLHGVASGGDIRVEVSSPGKLTTTYSGTGINVSRPAGSTGVTEVTFILPTSYNPTTGAGGYDLSFRAKIGSAGTWSPTKKLTYQ